MRKRSTQREPAQDHAVAIASIHAQSEQKVGTHQRHIERLSAQVGRPITIYLLLVAVGAWVLVNSALASVGRAPLDPPPYFWLQGLLGLYAALVSTVVLTTQTRQQKHAEQRAYLELQVNLIAEQKTAKVIGLLEELRRDMPSVRDRVDLEANAMSLAVDAEAVHTVLAETLDSAPSSREASESITELDSSA